MKTKYNFFTFLLIIFCVNFTIAQELEEDVLEMDLEALMNIEVTTASKKAQSIDDAPAAIYVITKEDIIMYGSNNIGEALRMVPGIDITQGGDQNYEVSARGISRTQYNTSNKILWLVNGRSVYNDAFGGVRIQSIPVSMDDIERIEVIRGAGSSLYGANAFQGIVNIITKNPEDQKGFFAKVAYGNLNQTNANIRYGGGNDKLSYKAVFGYDNIDKPEKRWAGLSADSIATLTDLGYLEGDINAYNVLYGNFAINYKLKENTNINVSGGFSDNNADSYYIFPGKIIYKDYFFQTNYNDEKNTFRFYFNGQQTDDAYVLHRFMSRTPADINDTLDLTLAEVNYLSTPGIDRDQFSHTKGVVFINQMIDFEYQRALQFGDKISAIMGASFRKNLVESNMFSVDRKDLKKDEDLAAVFAQFEYNPSEKLNLILGGRFDHHSTVGININPRFAAIYKLDDKQTLRFGAGTATRNPHMNDLYLNTYMKVLNLQEATGGLSPVFNLTGGSNYVNFHVVTVKTPEAEKLTSFEIGYINNISSKFQVKLDLFYNQMTNPIGFSIPVTTESIENIENLYAINPGFATDLSGLAPLNGGVDPSIPNQLSTTEMQAKITEIGNIADILEGMGDPYGNVNDLRTLVGGLQQLQALYGIPLVKEFGPENGDDTHTYYGGELSFVFIPMKNVTVSGSYAYLKFSDSFNDVELDDPYSQFTETKIISTIPNPEHKFNLGVKYKMGGLYAGLMFNFMSETSHPNDNNKDGTYDVGDIAESYGNDGLYTIDARMNLTVNIGYKVGKFDVFVTGYNLIQNEYMEIPPAYATTQGDYLNTRFMGGLRVSF
ncbi:MAG: TonB-dependent receptor [Bacteroidales bacterium]|nr:TonB-dependent receptor [Bacteroidales bacterium]